MIKKMAVAGSGLFLTIGELTINDWYIILLVIALGLSIVASIAKIIMWLVNKIKEAKKDDGKVSKEERKLIAKELKELIKQSYADVKSNSELVKEKVETELANKQSVKSPVPIDEE